MNEHLEGLASPGVSEVWLAGRSEWAAEEIWMNRNGEWPFGNAGQNDSDPPL